MKRILISLLSVLLIVSFFSCADKAGREGEVAAEVDEEIIKTFPADLKRKDRAMGAIMGALIGDALGVACHWYYDLECLEKDHGWITDYVDPKLDSECHGWVDASVARVKAGLKKGGPSQTGQFIIMLLESVAETSRHDLKDYTARLDEFFKTIDGTTYSGRYTNWVVRDTYRNRVKEGMSWDDPNVGSFSATSEGAQRAVVLAARYSGDPVMAAKEMYANIRLTFRDAFIVGQQLAYAIVVSALIEGVQLTDIGRHLQIVYGNREISPKLIQGWDTMSAVTIGDSAWSPRFRTFPPHKISVIHGMDCEQDHLLPAAYWLAHRYPNDFEAGILAAVNSGGNNMARATLTGAMLGAMNGLSGIPERFISGLENSEFLLELAEIVSRNYPKDIHQED
jgi:ADP-ribosylglycohydrolase